MMLIKLPDTVSVTFGEEESNQFVLEIINDDDITDLLIGGQTCQVQVEGPNRETEHRLKTVIETQIQQVIGGGENRSSMLIRRIKPNGTLPITVSLNELNHDRSFKKQIQPLTTFEVTITTLYNINKRFFLEVTKPNGGEPPMICVKQRLTLNLTEGGLFTIPLDQETAEQEWLTNLNLSDQPMALETRIDDILPEDGSELSEATLKDRILSALDTQQANVKQLVSGVIVQIPFKRDSDEPLTQDIPVILKLTFAKSNEYRVPVLLQRPAYLGFAAIDFGTTHSACVYYSPFPGPPTLPGRTLSEVQTQVLRETVEDLMNELEEKQQQKPYQLLAERFINQARSLWYQSEGGRVETFAEIRDNFQTLRKRAEDPNNINNMYAKLLVSWGTEGYRLIDDQTMTKTLARKYHQCLDRIINTDIQSDSRLYLPELDKGRPDGKLFSAIRMDELVTCSDIINQPPTIHPFNSKIIMGTRVEQNLKRPSDEVGQEPNLSNLNKRKERHKHYVTGVKRWLGQESKAYFIDRQNQLFEDNYDPLCMLGIKYIMTQTEKHLSPGNQSDDPGLKALNNLVITYPTNLSQPKRQHLESLVKNLGASKIDLRFDEATAAALYYVWRELFTDTFAGIDGFLARSRVREEVRQSKWTSANEKVKLHFQNILLYDMGGGTTDIALLEIGLAELKTITRDHGNWGRCFVIYPRILGLTGQENFAGDNVTLAVFRILKSKLAARVADFLLKHQEIEKSPEVSDVLQNIDKDPNGTASLIAWIENGDRKQYEEQKGKINTLVPTSFREQAKLQTSFFQLWKEAEKIKADLSATSAGETATAQSPTLFEAIDHLDLGIQATDLQGIEVSRAEMEQAILREVKNTFEKARNLCVGLEYENKPKVEHYIDRVILAGNSSQLRLVRETMPHDIFGKPFQMTVAGMPYSLPAPFKNDGHNLLFEPKEAKLAVARGACLGHYLREKSIPPTHPDIPNHLRKGIDFLYFDIDNLHSYIPFTLGYNLGSGVGSAILFAAGEEFNEPVSGGYKVARKTVAPVETLSCYRFDNVAQAELGREGDLYCQFDLYKAVADHNGLDVHQHRKQVEQLTHQYLFYVQLDMDRNLTCYMYPPLAGNPTETVRGQVDEVELKDHLCQKESGGLEWKSGWTLECNLSSISLQKEASARGMLWGKTPVCCNDDKQGGVHDFYVNDGNNKTLLWQINLAHYQIKTQFAELRVHISLDDPCVLEYSVYDPEPKDCIEIPQNFDDREKLKIFSPFSGDE